MLYILFLILQGGRGKDGPNGNPGPTVSELRLVIGVTALTHHVFLLRFPANESQTFSEQ